MMYILILIQMKRIMELEISRGLNVEYISHSFFFYISVDAKNTPLSIRHAQQPLFFIKNSISIFLAEKNKTHFHD